MLRGLLLNNSSAKFLQNLRFLKSFKLLYSGKKAEADVSDKEANASASDKNFLIFNYLAMLI